MKDCLQKRALTPSSILAPPPQRIVLAQDYQYGVKLVAVASVVKESLRYEVTAGIQFKQVASYPALQPACDEFNRLTERTV